MLERLKTFKYYPPALMYHTFDVSYQPVATYVPIDVFQQQVDILHTNKFNVLEPETFVNKFAENTLLKKDIVITFDDGFKDNLKAIDILTKYDMPAIIFVICDKLGDKGYLSKDDLLYIKNNSKVSISTHTMEHNYLPKCDASVARQTLKDSKKYLEDILGEELTLFSYPIGGYNEQIIQMVKESGFKGAFATNRGWGENEYCIKRININERDAGIKFLYKLSGYYWSNKKIKATC